MSIVKNMIGNRYGKLIVLEREGSIYGRATWKCKCDCGNITVVTGENLRKGCTTSCGCYREEIRSKTHSTHHLSKTRLYHIHQGMMIRCYAEISKPYKYYGGRGITVCDQWHDVVAFYNWAIDNGYEENLTIERIDTNGNYEPSNCKWITQAEQCKNKKDNHKVTFCGESHNVAEWERIRGFKKGTLKGRLLKGMSIEDAFNKPVRKRRISNAY